MLASGGTLRRSSVHALGFREFAHSLYIKLNNADFFAINQIEKL
jgi:hypothetical protein